MPVPARASFKKPGVLITFEGIDGSGKSTQVRRLGAWLRRRGFKPRVTHEPGGTRVGEQIRCILLASGNGELAAAAELLLMYAARDQHLEEIIRPALMRGELVLSDRFNDSSFAYQGHGRKLGEAAVLMLDRMICGRTQPSLTILLDAPPWLALKRTAKRGEAPARRRFENAGLQFQTRVRKGYLAIARKHPGRVKVVRADRSPVEVQVEIRRIVGDFLDRRR